MNFGDYTPDLPIFGGNGCYDALNVIPDAGFYKPFNRLVTAGAALPSFCRGAASFKVGSTVHTFAATATEVFRLSGATWQSMGSGFNLTAPFWSFSQFGDSVVCASGNPVDAIQKAPLAAGSLAKIATSPGADSMVIVKNFLITGRDNLVKWSGLNDVTQWTPGINQSDEQELVDGGHIRALTGGEYGLVFQEDAITRMIYTGDDRIFQFDKVEENHGALCSGGVIKHRDAVFYIANDGFYVTQGSGSEPIGHNKVDKTFFRTLQEEYVDRIIATADPINKLIIWAYPSRSGNGVCDRLMIYNYAEGRFSEAEADIEYLTRIYSTGYTLEQIGALYPAIEDVPYSFDSRFWSGGSLFLAGIGADHKIGLFNGASRTAKLQSGEWGGDPERVLLSVTPQIDGATCSASIQSRRRLADTPETQPGSDLSSDGSIFFRKRNRYFRLGVTIPENQNWRFAHGFEVSDERASGGRP